MYMTGYMALCKVNLGTFNCNDFKKGIALLQLSTTIKRYITIDFLLCPLPFKRAMFYLMDGNELQNN